jgi:Ca2+-binding RTX toxin-like protein
MVRAAALATGILLALVLAGSGAARNGYGNVWVVDTASESTAVAVNGTPVGFASGPSYPPSFSSLGVPRSLQNGPGVFGPTTDLSLEFPSGVFSAQVSIDPGENPITQDLYLFVSLNQATLENLYGVVLATVPLNEGSPLGGKRQVGTAGNDHIRGTNAGETIRGGPGNDTIDARGGNDVVFAGPGRDVVHAGSGNDVVYTHDGSRDVVDCGKGRDVVFADKRDRVAKSCELVRRTRR